MIGKIIGIVSEHYCNTAIIDIQCNNDCAIGYEVIMKQTDILSLQNGEKVTIFVKEIIKEDDDTFYGFLSFEDKCWFEELIKLSGLGPKTALTILSSYSCETITEAIMLNNCDFFSSISGIGSKIANRIPIEMRKTIEKINEKVSAVNNDTTISTINDCNNVMQKKSNTKKSNKIEKENGKQKDNALFDNLKCNDDGQIGINNDFIKNSNIDDDVKVRNCYVAGGNFTKNDNNKRVKTVKKQINNKNSIISDAVEALVTLGFNRSYIYSDVFAFVKNNEKNNSGNNDLTAEEIIKAFLSKMEK